MERTEEDRELIVKTAENLICYQTMLALFQTLKEEGFEAEFLERVKRLAALRSGISKNSIFLEG